MPVGLQTRLLRVIEEREVVPLGGEAPVKLDIRLVSATHCDLQARIAAKEFREDLFYRLHGVSITMPPLRERLDRRELILHLAMQECESDAAVVLDEPLLAALEHHPWPGNLRQLRHMLRSMIALRETDVLTLDDLPPEFAALVPATVAAPAPDTDPASALNPLESAERQALVQELTRHGWNMSTLARQLKISRNTLYRKVQRLNITNPAKAVLH
jgi:transcriptional regulator of acetoin/glycerol metabolism